MRYKKFSGPIDFLQRWLQKAFRRYTLPTPAYLTRPVFMHAHTLKVAAVAIKQLFLPLCAKGALNLALPQALCQKYIFLGNGVFGGHTCGKKSSPIHFLS